MFRIVQWLMDRLITLFSGDGNRAFFDTAQFPWAADLEKQWPTIRNELDAVLTERDRIPNFGDISEDANLTADRKPLSSGDEWKWFLLYGFGHKIEQNCARCPETARLAKTIPGMRSAV